MAQRVIHQLISDLSGVEIPEGDGETVSFGFQGTNYQVDLTNKELEKLEKALQPYIDIATQVKRTRTVGNIRKVSAPADNAAIREWANANGFKVGDRGRIPAEVKDAYDAAH